jgi:flagellar motility protein MotE (MotC chaperone)
MTKTTHAALAIAVAFALGAPAAAYANGGIGLKDYDLRAFKTVDGMGRQLAASRDDVDGVLFTMTGAQRAVQRAKRERDEAIAQYGADSHDAALSEGRYRRVKREQIKKTLAEMQVLVPRLKAAEADNRHRLKKLLAEKRNFKQLVRGHLEGKRNPVVLATLVYLATARLGARAEELYGNVLLGKIDIDIKEVKRTMELVGKLLDPKATTASIEQAWDELSPEGDALSLDPGVVIDELDTMLDEEIDR